MAVTPLNIIPAKQMESSQTAQYTATNVTTLVDKFTVTNTSGGAVTFSVNIVPLSGSASNANLLIDTKSLAVDETYTCPEIIGHIMANGDFISTIASAATSLTLRASGREIT